jgi:hypothetical protein
MENNKKAAFKQFINDLLENKFTRERLMELAHMEEVEEVCVEPFAYTDADGDVLPIQQKTVEPVLNPEPDAEFETLREVVEKMGDIVDDHFVNFTEEEIEYYKNLTEGMKPLDCLSIPCTVNGEDKTLYDGFDCNIKCVPLLQINMVTPLNLFITKVTLTSDMQSEEEIELDLILCIDEIPYIIKHTLGTLANAGILAVVDADEFELELSPVGYRGITKLVSEDELILSNIQYLN